MTAVARDSLRDDAARRAAMTELDKTMLVEAGAGSGKTAVMAGRVAMLLAAGIAPKSIVAISFTRLAASELFVRVRDYVGRLSSGGTVPLGMKVALPDGPSRLKKKNLETAFKRIDDIVCTTIHGFCERLITAYPVEADIDPGAGVIDQKEADIVFEEMVDAWLLETLNRERSDVLARLVFEDPDKTIRLVRSILAELRTYPDLSAVRPADPRRASEAFLRATGEFAGFVQSSGIVEPKMQAIASGLEEMVGAMNVPPHEESSTVFASVLFVAKPEEVFTGSGAFRKMKLKAAWTKAAVAGGIVKSDATAMYGGAIALYDACAAAWQNLEATAAGLVLADLVEPLKAVVGRFSAYKRSAALLDFDDLLRSARDLLCGNDTVRRALGKRHKYVLVDEFQDTDPLQAEILWRLCGDPPGASSASDWRSYQIRTGALFIVGDPNQAIYRFRGADINTYLEARKLLGSADDVAVHSISTNFRSRAPILTFVNELFAEPLSKANGQGGLTPLDAHRTATGDEVHVAALNYGTAGEKRVNIKEARNEEAEAVANMCARLIGTYPVEERSGDGHPCRAGDIALLAPTGTDLWLYEAAMEKRGFPVMTQAGKGFFQRQEIQDLVALTRVLADGRDTLALGALLRGPLVGLTEEELFDLVWDLPRTAGERPLKLDMGVNPADIAHPVARDVIERLRSLRRLIHSTSPYDLLSRALDSLRVRPILLQRFYDRADRPFANVDQFLSLSRAYSVRGFQAFADAMSKEWEEGGRTVEGRPDSQEDAVSIYTIHSAKGLEWPIVVPVNTLTGFRRQDQIIVDRKRRLLHVPVFGRRPVGYKAAHERESAEGARERIRLWYVATTRAKELLVLPRHASGRVGPTWMSLLDRTRIAALRDLDLHGVAAGPPDIPPVATNDQSFDQFAAETAAMAAGRCTVTWEAPSRRYNAAVAGGRPATGTHAETAGEWPEVGDPAFVGGGLDRGNVVHKLFEEILTEETAEPDIERRAGELIASLERPGERGPQEHLSAKEIADCVARTLALPRIAELRPKLVAEFPVWSSDIVGKVETAGAGFVDAVTFDAEGAPEIIVDWKSDVKPTRETLHHYRRQVATYLDMTGAATGLIVLATTGTIIEVTGAG